MRAQRKDLPVSIGLGRASNWKRNATVVSRKEARLTDCSGPVASCAKSGHRVARGADAQESGRQVSAGRWPENEFIGKCARAGQRWIEGQRCVTGCFRVWKPTFRNEQIARDRRSVALTRSRVRGNSARCLGWLSCRVGGRL